MRGDIGPRDELYMVDPQGKLDKMDKDEHHLEYLMNFYPDEEDYNEDFWDTIFDGGWIRIELRENNTNGWNLNLNGKSLYRMKAVVRDNFMERLKRGENKVHIEEWTGSGMNPTHIFYLPYQKDDFYEFIFEKFQAKFVFETLEFERKPLSRETLNVGATELLKKFLEENTKPSFQDLKNLPFSLMTSLTILKNHPEFLDDLEIWDFYDFSKENVTEGEKELIDMIFSDLYHARGIQKVYTAQLDGMVGYSLPGKFFKEMPYTAESIKQNPLPFLYQGLIGFGNLSPYFYRNYFDPFKYTLEEIIKGKYLVSISQIIDDFPEYYDYFRKNASPKQKILGETPPIYYKFPEFLEDFLIGNFPIDDDIAERIIYNLTPKSSKNEIIILKKYLENNPDKKISDKIKRKISRKNYKEFFEKIYGVKESVNFERGLDPKESMTIGTEAQKKKLDKETDWGFEFSKAFRVRTYDIIKYEGFLIKIVQVMGSDGIAYYAALNDIGEPYTDTPTLYNTPEEALDWEQKYIDQYNMGL